MKESSFHSDEFEVLIREKTEQYKMYPSENVWKGVHNSLHTRRKWFIGSMALLVTGILFFSGRELLTPSHTVSRKLAASAGLTDNSNTDQATSAQSEDNSRNNFVRVRTAGSSNSAGRRVNTAGTGGMDQEDADQPYNHLAITVSHPVVSQPDLSELLSHAIALPGEAPSLISDGRTMPGTMPRVTEPAQQESMLDSWLARNAPDNSAPRRADAVTARNSAEAGRETAELAGTREASRDIDDDAAARMVLESLSAHSQRARAYGNLAKNASPQAGAVTGRIRDSAGASRVSTDAVGEESDRSRVNWLHDYAVYTLPPNPNRGRWYLQLNLAPTVNYRSLAGGTMAATKGVMGPVASFRPGDVQSWVDHSPGLGFEFGGNVLYRATRNLTLKAGVQFNYSRYKMLAYTTTPQQQQQPAYRTPLGNYLYMDSLFVAAPTSVNGGPVLPNPIQATLYNVYYQISAPVGFELRVLGNERLQLNIGATIQPTYLLNTDAYIVTADYTSYTKEPSVFRRWNVSGAVEAFLSYQTGPVRWQLGPEFRYQLFSTYNSGPYPISENLRGYGLKVGITKPLP